MRIAYGVFGYGRGHATRTAAVLPALQRRHDVLLLAGGQAYEILSRDYPVCRIPTLGYGYRGARRSNYLTLKQNLRPLLDLALCGPASRAVDALLGDFRPDAVVSDAEPWTHRAALRLGVPRIAFDHFGILVHCRHALPLLDRVRRARDAAAYRWLMGGPQRVIISSFYDAPPRRAGVRIVGPLLRDAVLAAQPRRGAHLLVYLNNGRHQFTPQMEAALRRIDVPVRIYGTPRQGASGRIEFRAPGDLPFVEDLASCRALLSTAGNQLMGEALHLGKPMLVMPEDCVEQRLNAAAVARLGIGMQVTAREFSAGVLQRFLAAENEYAAAIRTRIRDGRSAALAALEQFLVELTGRGPASVPTCRRVAREVAA